MKNQLICIIYCLGMMIELLKADNETTIEIETSTVTERTTTEIIDRKPICKTMKLPSGKLYADCIAKNWNKVLDILDRSEIEVLNMSLINLSALSEDSFQDFVNLRELIMKKVEADDINEQFLAPLIQLEILDISESSVPLNAVKLPSFIQQLAANHLMRQIAGTVLDLSNLGSLSELSIASNNLQEFPNLNKECPIVYIDLSGNPLQHFKYEDLAPFCTLESLILNSTMISSGEACCSLKAWMTEFAITTTLKCRKTCDDVNLDADKKEIYRQCEIRIGRAESQRITHVIEVIAVLALMLATSYLVHKYYSAPAVIFEKKQKLEEEAMPETDEEQSSKEV